MRKPTTAAGPAYTAPANIGGAEVNLLQWNHFIPTADPFFKDQAAAWGKQTGVNVTVETINANDLTPRFTAAIQGQSGPTIFQMQYVAPHSFGEGLYDLSDLANEIQSKFGKFNTPVRDARVPDQHARRSAGSRRGRVAVHASVSWSARNRSTLVHAAQREAISPMAATTATHTTVASPVAIAATPRRNRRPLMLVVPLKDQQLEVNNPSVFPFWPFHPNLEQYFDLFARTQFPRWALNTTIVALLSTLVALTFGSLAGYALARLRFRGAGLLGIITFVTYLVPQTLLFIPPNIVITRLPVPLFLVTVIFSTVAVGLPVLLLLVPPEKR